MDADWNLDTTKLAQIVFIAHAKRFLDVHLNEHATVFPPNCLQAQTVCVVCVVTVVQLTIRRFAPDIRCVDRLTD